LKVVKETAVIVLNANELQVPKASLKFHHGKTENV
jgi:hypothetical protein